MQKLLFIIATALLFSCNKSKDENNQPNDPEPEKNARYMKLDKGNYWIYQQQVAMDNNVLWLTSVDSIYVDGDSLINGKKYTKLMVGYNPVTRELYRLLRDSADYIVDERSKIVFSANDFMNSFDTTYLIPNDTAAKIISKMSDKDIALSFPAGIFLTRTLLETWYLYPGFDYGGKIRTKEWRYAKNVGMVYENIGFYSTDSTHMERVLLRYHVQ